jgi:hypothetical protein
MCTLTQSLGQQRSCTLQSHKTGYTRVEVRVSKEEEASPEDIRGARQGKEAKTGMLNLHMYVSSLSTQVQPKS